MSRLRFQDLNVTRRLRCETESEREAPAGQVLFKPPYVGTRGWVGIVLNKIGEGELKSHIELAWDLVRRKR